MHLFKFPPSVVTRTEVELFREWDGGHPCSLLLTPLFTVAPWFSFGGSGRIMLGCMVCKRHKNKTCSFFYHPEEGKDDSGLATPVLGTQAPPCVSSLAVSSKMTYSPPVIMSTFWTKAGKRGQRKTWHIPLRTFPGSCVHYFHLNSVGEKAVTRLFRDPLKCSLHSGWLDGWLIFGCLVTQKELKKS